VDVPGQRLFVAGLGNHSLEVVDLAAGRAQSVGKLGKPQGTAYLPAQRRVFVADGDLGAVVELDGQTLAEVRRTDGLPDADNLRHDRAGERLYVGYGDGGIRVIDARNGAPLADIKLPAHPEGFALDDGAKRIYANLPDAGVIAVIDTERNAIVQRWR